MKYRFVYGETTSRAFMGVLGPIKVQGVFRGGCNWWLFKKIKCMNYMLTGPFFNFLYLYMQKCSRPIQVLLGTPAVPLRYDGGLKNQFLFCLCSATTDCHRVKFG